MKLKSVDDALVTCKDHLDATGTAGTGIEAFLTQHLLVLICAAFEQQIKALVAQRAKSCGDEAVAAFVSSATVKLLRSIRTSEIAGFLGTFSPACKQRFKDELADRERAETYFNNIVVNRHATAHEMVSTVTLAELIQFYTEGHVVLDAISAALESTQATLGQ